MSLKRGEKKERSEYPKKFFPPYTETPLRDTEVREKVYLIQTKKAEAKALEVEIDELKVEIMAEMMANGVDLASFGDWKASTGEGTNTTIKAEILLEEGVSVETIEKATVSTKYPKLTITAVKGGGGGEEEE